jgi:GYF domain 2
LQSQASGGQLKRDSLVWKAGMAQWAKAETVPELAGLFANLPPPLPPQ